MTDSPKRTTSSRALIIVLALGLVIMLAASLKERFEKPSLTEQRRPGPAAQAGGQDDDAQQIGKLMRQVAENPNDSTAMIHLVEHLVSAQNWDAAETFAQRAVTLDTGNSKPLYLLGVIMHNQGRNKEAAEALEKVLVIKDEASVRYSLGVLYIYFLENPAKGVEHLSAGLNDPKAAEELKKAMVQELEKAQQPQQNAKSEAEQSAKPENKSADKAAKAKAPAGNAK
ncbi:tetratricopeptide repeat protein [Desulfovibrio intestinalis]|uniref:Flp pilus assembly protein TadD n=1 Tax=Desulfovibrio intestinalis TaxID=58621 RepID=A0A7W8C5E0_9BACT|nr:hypothetical protein [Desulfovibrio intestinalis]MBB5144644.1 Flp pilus assembly protein TadD [Desulfovibrio intestinalis]